MIDISDYIVAAKFHNEIMAEKDFEALIRGTVCHEMQNPLNSIINQTELINILISKFQMIND
jgi:hypothetical protein